MAAYEFCRRMDHDVRAVFDRAQQIRRCERIIDDERYTVSVCDFGDRSDVDYRRVRIAERFDEKRLRIRLDSLFEIRGVAAFDERRGYAEILERMREQVVRAAVQRDVGYDVIASARDILDRTGHRGLAGRDGNGADAAFERGDALLERVVRGIRYPRVNEAAFRRVEARRGLRRVFEHIRRRLVYRHGARAGRRFGFFLPGVQLQRFELILFVYIHMPPPI